VSEDRASKPVGRERKYCTYIRGEDEVRGESRPGIFFTILAMATRRPIKINKISKTDQDQLNATPVPEGWGRLEEEYAHDRVSMDFKGSLTTKTSAAINIRSHLLGCPNDLMIPELRLSQENIFSRTCSVEGCVYRGGKSHCQTRPTWLTLGDCRERTPTVGFSCCRAVQTPTHPSFHPTSRFQDFKTRTW
jgi:hypothetical protein